MLHLKLKIKDVMRNLARTLDTPYTVGLRLREGEFDVAARCITYGAGSYHWIRVLTDTSDLLVFIQLRIDNTGTASVSLHDDDGTYRQWKIELGYRGEYESLPDSLGLDFISFLKARHIEHQLSLDAQTIHEATLAKYDATRAPVIFMNTSTQKLGRPGAKKSKTVNTEKEAVSQTNDLPWEDPDMDDGPAGRRFGVSFRYKSPETLGYCVIVMAVTSRTRDDRYALVLKAPSFILQNCMLLYSRGFFGKLMNTIGNEHKAEREASHLLNFQKLSRTRAQAVCVTLPVSEGVVDNTLSIGNVYDIKHIDKNIGGDEYITINVNGEDIERHASNFVIYK